MKKKGKKKESPFKSRSESLNRHDEKRKKQGGAPPPIFLNTIKTLFYNQNDLLYNIIQSPNDLKVY